METFKRATIHSSKLPKPSKNELKVHLEKVREFLQTFKVRPCMIDHEHNLELCYFHHGREDKRRNPYSTHQFLYDPDTECSCQDQNCTNYHSIFEKLYHPTEYKSEQCYQFMECPLQLYCPKMHIDDLIAFEYSEFFRFDIRTFKSKHCPRKDSHQRKTCLYYHDRDRRRPTSFNYTHFICKDNCKDPKCQFSHNKIEQLYHPSRYKSKFCQHYPKNIEKCEYREFCSFAHTPAEITIELIHLSTMDTNFYINQYKTVWCPYTNSHERNKCVYAHNFQDFRRKPSEFKYLPEECEYWNFSDRVESIEEGGCKNGMNCNKCHGRKQITFHPQIYKKSKKDQFDKLTKKQTRNLKESNQVSTKISMIIQDTRKGICSKGAPFFKQEKQSSQASRKTKARTNCLDGSDISQNGSSANEESSTNMAPTCSSIQAHSYIQTHNILNLDLINDEDSSVWVFNNNTFDCKASQNDSRSRCKSEKKSDEHSINYSKSIVEMFKDDSAILEVFKREKITEPKLKKLTSDKSRLENLSDFTNIQKREIEKKLLNYNLKLGLQTIHYSKQITKFFVDKNYSHVLENFRSRKIKEQKLIKVSTKELLDYSFLAEAEREELPKMMAEFRNQKQFAELSKEIQQKTSK